MNGQKRADIKVGAKVKIVLKADQHTGRLTEGVAGQGCHHLWTFCQKPHFVSKRREYFGKKGESR